MCLQQAQGDITVIIDKRKLVVGGSTCHPLLQMCGGLTTQCYVDRDTTVHRLRPPKKVYH